MQLDLAAVGGSLGLSLIGALTFIAYKHPDGYSRLQWGIRFVIALTMVAAMAWERGLGAGAVHLSAFIEQAKMPSALQAVQALQVPIPIILGGAVIAFVYFEFLGFLPYLLAEKPPKK